MSLDGRLTIHCGDALETLRTMASGSVDCIVTSPPYFGLRAYLPDGHPDKHLEHGLEQSPDEYVARLVEVFREARRVLADTGCAFVNLGDSYAGARGGPQGENGQMVDRSVAKQRCRENGQTRIGAGLKPKDLIGIPWAVAFALRADGWYLRQDIIWCLSGGAWIYARTPKGVGPMMLKDLVRLKPETVELWTGERWTRVVAWTQRQGRADAREIVLRSGERIGCTDNHVWPTSRGNISTADLIPGDVISTTKLPTGGQPAGWLTDEALWFAGLYLAEGSRSGTTMQISGHTKETERFPRIEALCDHYGGSARQYVSGNSESIHIDSIGLEAVVRSLVVGKRAVDKRLAPRVWQLRDWALRKIAEGYLEGDGHDDGARIRLGFCRNYALERDLRCLGARLGATVVIKPCNVKNQTGTWPAFRGEWRWERSGHRNERQIGEVVEIRNSRARKFWDVTVADWPHLFALASGVLTHNSKPNPMPESVTDRCTKAHEHVFLLSKAAKYWYDAKAVAEPASLNKPWSALSNGGEKAAFVRGDGNPQGLGVAADETRNRRSVWTIATQPFDGVHYATMPPALAEICIKAGCPKGGTVLDVFGGAGTTALAALRYGRKAVLIELSPNNCEMARRRIEREWRIPQRQEHLPIGGLFGDAA